MNLLNNAINLILLFCLGAVGSNPVFKSIDSQTYFVNHAELRENDQYHLYWNFTETDVIFKTVVKTTGWIGFGLSPTGGMYNSDVVLAWFSPDSTENFVDAHVAPSGLHKPIVDVYQNWKKIYMSQENGFTTVIFTRKLKICGQADSGEINIDIGQSQPLIFAWGDGFQDKQRTFPTYHGNTNRATRFLPILGSLNENVELNLDEIEHKDFFVNFTLPDDIVTEYMCHMFDVPNEWYNHKRHVIRYDSLVKPENKKYVHHWLIYECDARLEKYLETNPVPKPASCLSGEGDWGIIKSMCTRITLAWATGGNYDVTFPEEFGFPIGGDHQESKHFIIEMHYENPALDKNIHDETGIRLYAQQKERPIEFGILTVGSNSNPVALTIPPQSKKMSIDNICRKKFMNEFMQGNQINIFAQLPHTHLAGVEFYSKILRNNTEVELISNNPYYDSNFQYVNFMKDQVVLKQDDEIITTCKYNTQDRSKYTLGGLGTYDEMCLNFIWYYPRNEKLATCYQEVDFNEWLKFFSKLNHNNDFTWVVNNRWTFWEDTIASLQASEKLTNDPEYTERLFQEFYDSAAKAEIKAEMPGQVYELYPQVDIERLPKDEC